MADNTTINVGTGGDVIATDDVTTLNGAASTGVKVQRVKVGFGTDNTYRDVDASNGLPVTGSVALSAGAATIGAISNTSFAVTQATPANLQATVTHQTLTKGTQGTTGVSTQDLKDAGRVIKVFSASFTAAATEALITLTPITDGTAGTAATSFAVTAGKRLRLQALSVNTRNAGAAVQAVVVQLRMTSTGAVTATSPLIATLSAGTLTATANIANGTTISFPDGLEISGTQQIGISQIGTATAGNTVTLIGYEY